MNFFRTVFAACSQFRNYRAFRDVAPSTSLKYLIKLVSLLSLIGLICFVPQASELMETFARWADQHLPVFELKDGHVKSAVKQPYSTGDSTFRFILDTTGQVTQPDTNSMQGLLVTSDSFVFWVISTNDNKVVMRSQHQNLRGFPDGVVNGDYFRQLIHAFAWVAFPLGLVLIILIALLTSLAQSYAFAFIASIMERGHPRGLQLPQLLNIAIHAITPALIVYTAYRSLRLQDIDVWLLALIIHSVYFVAAAGACRDRLPTEEREEDGLL